MGIRVYGHFGSGLWYCCHILGSTHPNTAKRNNAQSMGENGYRWMHHRDLRPHPFQLYLELGPKAQWQDPFIYILLIASLALFCLFGYIERKATFPLIPFSAITPNICFVLAILACGWAAFGVWVFYGW